MSHAHQLAAAGNIGQPTFICCFRCHSGCFHLSGSSLHAYRTLRLVPKLPGWMRHLPRQSATIPAVLTVLQGLSRWNPLRSTTPARTQSGINGWWVVLTIRWWGISRWCSLQCCRPSELCLNCLVMRLTSCGLCMRNASPILPSWRYLLLGSVLNILSDYCIGILESVEWYFWVCAAYQKHWDGGSHQFESSICSVTQTCLWCSSYFPRAYTCGFIGVVL